MEEQLTAGTELQDEVQLLGGLECVLQVDNERVVDVFQDEPFREGVLHLVFLDQVFFLQYLNCVDLLVIFFLAK